MIDGRQAHEQIDAAAGRFRTITDLEQPFDGLKLTVGERFRQERLKFEEREGKALLVVLAGTRLMGKQRLRSIENGDRTLPADVMVALLSFGFDLHYILWGERLLTEAERVVRDVMRRATPEGRLAIIALAETVPIEVVELRDAYGETVALAGKDGHPLSVAEAKLLTI